MSPIAIGIEVVLTWNWFSTPAMPGKRYPTPTPMSIAREIQSVRSSFKRDSRALGFSATGDAPVFSV